jgi:hypothetical protein
MSSDYGLKPPREVYRYQDFDAAVGRKGIMEGQGKKVSMYTVEEFPAWDGRPSEAGRIYVVEEDDE